MDHGPGQAAFIPTQVNLESAPCAKAGDLAGRPRPGQCRQEMDRARMALHQHLADSGCRTKIAINLERRMGVEKVRINAGAAISVDGFRPVDHVQQASQHSVGVIAVPQPGPEIDFPGAAPASAFVAAGLQGNAGGFGQFRGGCPGDLATGIQGEQM